MVTNSINGCQVDCAGFGILDRDVRCPGVFRIIERGYIKGNGPGRPQHVLATGDGLVENAASYMANGAALSREIDGCRLRARALRCYHEPFLMAADVLASA